MITVVIILTVILGLVTIMVTKPKTVESVKGYLGNGNNLRRNRTGEENNLMRKELESLNDTLVSIQEKVSVIESRETNNRHTISNLEDYIRDIVAELSENIENLRHRIGSLEKGMNENINRIQVISESYKKSSNDNTPTPEYPKIYYALYPDKDVFGFRIDQLFDEREDAIYQIICETPDKATYQIIPDGSVRTQLFQMMNSVVAPFCEIVISSDNGETIRDISPGVLRRVGESWIIHKKATIEVI